MKRVLKLSTLLSFSCLPLVGEAEVRPVNSIVDNSPYQMQVFTSVVKENSSDGHVSGAALIPLLQTRDSLFYTQIGRQQGFKIAAVTSTNLGLRWLTDQQSMMWGVYGGYDYQQTENNNVYHTFSLGAEWRTERWHIYTNGYLPTSRKNKSIVADNIQAQLSADTDANGLYTIDLNHQYTERYEEAMRGIDANVGYTFWKAINAQVYLGVYSYRANHVASQKGSRAQLNFDLYNAYKNNSPSDILNRVTFESMVQYDKTNKTSWYAGLKFVFDLNPKRAVGRFSRLNTMQQYMQYEIPRSVGTRVDSYDVTAQVSGKHYNSAGQLFTVAKVSSESAFDDAITNNADVIAVQGHINNMSTKALNDGQVVTGGEHTLTNGATLTLGNAGQLTASTGRDTLRVGKNNRIENIILNADSGQYVIANNLNTSVGTLAIANVTANAGMQVVIKNGSTDSVVNVTGSNFTLPLVDNLVAIYMSVEAGTLQTSLTNNRITILGREREEDNGNGRRGIFLYSFSASDVGSTIRVNALNDNIINIGDGNNYNGIRFNSSDNNEYVANLYIDQLKNNTITFGNGDSNTGITFIASSGGEQGQVIANNIINNNIRFSSGSMLSAFNLVANSFGVNGRGLLTLNTVYGNAAEVPNSTGELPYELNYDFKLTAGNPIDVTDDKITIKVNYQNQSLAAANNNATVNPVSDRGRGVIVIDPFED